MQAVVDMLAVVSSTTMYVMQQCGPTSFIVKEDSDAKQYHVTVGSLQQCTCQRQTQASAELCRHIVFVMVKVLKVHPENPLVWQLSLVGENHSSLRWCSAIFALTSVGPWCIFLPFYNRAHTPTMTMN